jgi:uncharacterized membrane protein
MNNSNINKIEQLTNNFLQDYYSKTSEDGWNTVQHLYEPYSIINYNSNKLHGGYELLNYLSYNYVKKANYKNLKTSWFIIDNLSIVINIFGNIQFVSFFNSLSKFHTFSECFIIKMISNKCHVSHHSFDYS